jgi:hypothetical protein
MSISSKLAAQSGVVTDYDGSRPCIPPEVLAVMAERVGLRARVLRDDREEAGE